MRKFLIHNNPGVVFTRTFFSTITVLPVAWAAYAALIGGHIVLAAAAVVLIGSVVALPVTAIAGKWSTRMRRREAYRLACLVCDLPDWECRKSLAAIRAIDSEMADAVSFETLRARRDKREAEARVADLTGMPVEVRHAMESLGYDVPDLGGTRH